MKKLIITTISLVMLAACNSNPHGELVGVQ
ncbi:MAG: lipoprotein, partial [Owenweeksia sp.]